MRRRNKTIRVFEHSFLPLGTDFKKQHLEAFSKLNALHDDRYFDLRYNGLKFKNFVGIVQVDGLTVEILPKIDSAERDTQRWQQVLIEMLKATKKLQVQQVGQANVTQQNIHLLDIYFDWFLREIELLIRQGLIKQYYNETSNVKALKGKLEFAGQLRKNLIHKERFYTTHQIYAQDHLIHLILSAALGIIEDFSQGTYLYSRCKAVQLDFPEVDKKRIDSTSFSRLKKSRKSAPYASALEIARLIILNYAPNISSGRENMLALLFNMNSLWEEYVLVQLKKVALHREGIEVKGQRSKGFWQGINLRPDIVVEKDGETFVIDTKWKNVGLANPSTQDLRQMYVYNDYWKSFKAVLLYPTDGSELAPDFQLFHGQDHSCGIGKLNILEKGKLRKDLGERILKWFKK